MKGSKHIIDKIERRIKFLSAKMFELIERRMPEVTEFCEWPSTRNDILDLMNQVLRGNKKDLEDCDIVYRPLAISDDGKRIRISIKVIDLMRNIELQSDPFSLSLKSSVGEKDVVDSIRNELKCGLTAMEANKYIYYVKGEDCVKLLPVLDRLTLLPDIKRQYVEWRDKLNKHYLENDNG